MNDPTAPGEPFAPSPPGPPRQERWRPPPRPPERSGWSREAPGDRLGPGAQGTPNGHDGRGSPPPGGPAGPRPLRSRQRDLIWIIAIVAVVAILARAHRITGTEVVLFCVIVPSIILHEISHGWVALAFGDDTARRAGRLTLNPIAHVDPVGTLIVPGLMALSGIGMFGWAKPVPVNIGRLRHPRNQAVLVSLAGPLTNVLLATAAGLLFVGFHGNQGTISPVTHNFDVLWAEVLFYLGLTNIWLAAFNLIPVPPLDGSVLLERMLPRRWWPAYLRLRPYTMPLLLGLVLLNFYLHPGPLDWLFQHLFTWWANMLGLIAG